MNAPCSLCHKRRARRQCPGIGGEICSSCCGTERENTIDCPQTCEFLKEARLREQPIPVAEDQFPNKDIRVTESFLREHDELVVWLANTLLRAMTLERAVDFDAREALDASIRTYRTRESGLIYETRPANPFAAALQDALNRAVEEFRKHQVERAGMQSLRDSEVLGVLAFLQRVELQYNNGRRRGRAFFDFLSSHFPAEREPAVSL